MAGTEKSKPREKVSIIGGGRVGSTLGFLLARAGYHIRGVSCLRADQAEEAVRFIGEGAPFDDNTAVVMDSRILFITTQDEAIAEVARTLAETSSSWKGRLVVHCSGFLSSDVLEPLRLQGALTATAHPLQAVASPRESVKSFKRCFFFLQGERDALDEVDTIVNAIGARALRLDQGKKPLYHAAAVMASNYLVTLMDLCVDLMAQAGVHPEEAQEALFPLIHGALENVKRMGFKGALTGPISRGDLATVQGHLEEFRLNHSKAEMTYRSLALATVDLALGGRGGLTLERAWELREILKSRIDTES